MPPKQKRATTKAVDPAESLIAIKRECQALLQSDATMFINFAVRTLAEARTCETQLPSVKPPAHALEFE